MLSSCTEIRTLNSGVRIEIRRTAEHSPWSYSDLDRRQREIAEEVHGGKPGALLLNEVSPVITVGRRTASTDLLTPREQLSKAGIEVHPTDRGGLATWHGPGQWVLFAVDTLERLTGDTRGIRRVVEGLLETALAVGREFEPRAEIRSGPMTGVWTPRGKFAAVGIHVEQRVVLHGLALNGFRSRTSFMGLRPCGLDLPVDFLLAGMSEGAEREREFQGLAEKLEREALRNFWRGGKAPA